MCLTVGEYGIITCIGMLVVLVHHCMWAVIILFLYCTYHLVLYVVEYQKVVHVLIVGRFNDDIHLLLCIHSGIRP